MKSVINWSYHWLLTKIVRQLAWILKLKGNWIHWQNGESEDFTRLSVTELQSSKKTLIKHSQMEFYPFEYLALHIGQQVSKSSKFSPFMNDERVSFVRGCLKFKNSPSASKNQMMSKSHHLARMIITDIYQRNLHSGREQTLWLICNFYWMPSCRCLIRTVLRRCLYCKRYTVKAKTTCMTDLPKGRISACQKPFTSTGKGLFSPMLVKRTKGRRSNFALVKRYGIIFTLFFIIFIFILFSLFLRIVHLELTNDLSTDSFIVALRRIKSRRGHVQVIRSDNDTIFFVQLQN